MKKLKILVSCYACGPERGSEPGMGWQFVSGLSKYHELHVIVEKRKWEPLINEYLNKHPSLNENLRFYFIDKKRNKWLRKIWPPSYYWFYKKWQKKAFKLALTLDGKENFDLVHHLNMVGYREPGYLWKFNKPFVWGPVGGLENSPWSFLAQIDFKGFLHLGSRNLINQWQRKYLPRPKKAASRGNSAVIAATAFDARLISSLWKRDDVELITEVGQEYIDEVQSVERACGEPLKIIWSGLHISRKNLPLLIRSLKNIAIPFELHILGEGKLTKRWRNLAIDLDVGKFCVWHGWLKRDLALETTKTGHVFCITSLQDLTSTVTLEALSYGLPIICLDHCGFANVVTDDCGIKIPIDNPKNARREIANALVSLYKDEQRRQELSIGAVNRAKDFSWEMKVKKLNRIYEGLTG